MRSTFTLGSGSVIRLSGRQSRGLTFRSEADGRVTVTKHPSRRLMMVLATVATGVFLSFGLWIMP